MADLVRDGDDLVVRLSRWEAVGAFHGDIRVPVAQVETVRPVTDAWKELRGLRAPGTGLPGVIALGTRRGGFGKDFTAVYGHRPGVVVEVADGEFGRIVLTVERPQALAASLRGTVRRRR